MGRLPHRFTLAVAFFVTVILVAQLLILPDYVWTEHTISELAAQGVPTAWVMQSGFPGFGGLMVWALWGEMAGWPISASVGHDAPRLRPGNRFCRDF